MGDRANCVIRNGEHAVWLYTHWGGTEMPARVREALARKLRWDDASYLARIVNDAMVGDDAGTETGHGIWVGPVDNEHDVIVLDVAKQRVYVCDLDSSGDEWGKLSPPKAVFTFQEFADGALTPEEVAEQKSAEEA